MNFTRLNGLGTCSRSQLFIFQNFSHSTTNGIIGSPVFLANKTGPGLASYLGPRGPSTVNAVGRPARITLIIPTTAPLPPRDDEPRATPNPNLCKNLAMYSPSRLCEVMTTMPRPRRKYVPATIRSCQTQ